MKRVFFSMLLASGVLVAGFGFGSGLTAGAATSTAPQTVSSHQADRAGSAKLPAAPRGSLPSTTTTTVPTTTVPTTTLPSTTTTTSTTAPSTSITTTTQPSTTTQSTLPSTSMTTTQPSTTTLSTLPSTSATTTQPTIPTEVDAGVSGPTSGEDGHSSGLLALTGIILGLGLATAGAIGMARIRGRHEG